MCANCKSTTTSLKPRRYDGLYVIIRAGMEPSQSGPLVCRWGAASGPAVSSCHAGWLVVRPAQLAGCPAPTYA